MRLSSLDSRIRALEAKEPENDPLEACRRAKAGSLALQAELQVEIGHRANPDYVPTTPRVLAPIDARNPLFRMLDALIKKRDMAAAQSAAEAEQP